MEAIEKFNMSIVPFYVLKTVSPINYILPASKMHLFWQIRNPALIKCSHCPFKAFIMLISFGFNVIYTDLIRFNILSKPPVHSVSCRGNFGKRENGIESLI